MRRWSRDAARAASRRHRRFIRLPEDCVRQQHVSAVPASRIVPGGSCCSTRERVRPSGRARISPDRLRAPAPRAPARPRGAAGSRRRPVVTIRATPRAQVTEYRHRRLPEERFHRAYLDRLTPRGHLARRRDVRRVEQPLREYRRARLQVRERRRGRVPGPVRRRSIPSRNRPRGCSSAWRHLPSAPR